MTITTRTEANQALRAGDGPAAQAAELRIRQALRDLRDATRHVNR